MTYTNPDAEGALEQAALGLFADLGWRTVDAYHEVYADALRYAEFLDHGEPVTFEVPQIEGPVLSALRLGDRLLVRRTDFAEHSGPISLQIAGSSIDVPHREGQCQILTVPPPRAGSDNR